MSKRSKWIDPGIILPAQALPSNPVAGEMVRDSSGAYRIYNGTSWVLAVVEKQYVAGTAYTNGTPTITAASWTTVRGVIVPYQTTDGAWRLKFNLSGQVPSGSRTGLTITISGVTFKNIANYSQPIAGVVSAITARSTQSYVVANSGNMVIEHDTDTTTAYYASGDVELESKPTWAD